jgi:hypothetical protein
LITLLATPLALLSQAGQPSTFKQEELNQILALHHVVS